jgi:putative exosortase-associated protein (TIGR04073 family)
MIAMAMVITTMPQEAPAAKGPYYETSYGAHVSKKLIRGFENLAFCLVEIPKEIIVEWQRTDPFTGVWLGFGRGLYMTGRRFAFGVYDIVTFGFRLPWDDRVDPEIVLLDRID